MTFFSASSTWSKRAGLSVATMVGAYASARSPAVALADSGAST